MKIFIKLPTWLGDAVMASASVRAIFSHFKGADFVLYGSFVALELFKECEGVSVVLEEKKNRFKNFLKLRQSWGRFDYAFFFRGALSAKMQCFLLSSRHKAIFNKNKYQNAHQVLKYLHFIEDALPLSQQNRDLFLPIKPFKDLEDEKKRFLCEKFKLDSHKQWLGINPGAKYGSAKCWEKEHFTRVALELSADYMILIFGTSGEREICDFICDSLEKNGIRAINLCDQTSIRELCVLISALSLFITNDSGSMHIAAFYQIKTLAIFGPTQWTQSAPWHNPKAQIIHLDLPCMPCMKRHCPLGHHKCMKDLSPEFVLNALQSS